MGEGGPLVNVGDLAKPATLLIEKISEAIGGLAKPFQIKRVAEAQADAEVIRAKAEIRVSELQRRALRRFIAEETRKQDNIESITRKALPHLSADSRPQELENDWVAHFFEKCRLVSDQEIQSLWAKVLAGEANSPSKYSKRTVAFLASLDKRDAALFTNLCGYAWLINDDDMVPLVYDLEAPVYLEHAIVFDALMHLDEIGLLSFDPHGTYGLGELAKRVQVLYHGERIHVDFPADADNELDVGHVLLSRVGQELATICGAHAIPGFLRYVIDRWSHNGLVLSSPYPRKT